MILGFKKTFPWKEPTSFREKILASSNRMEIIDRKSNGLNSELIRVEIYNPKIHTMREDKHDRWKAGRSIQMVYRGKNYSIEDHFNKGIAELGKCVSTQKVEIKWLTKKQLEKLKGASYYDPEIRIDGRFINIAEQNMLAINDGFTDDADIRYGKDALQKFLRWFNKDWQGKIIHWTDFRY